MTARGRVDGARAALAAGAVSAALLWGAAIATLAIALAGVADWIVNLPRPVRERAVPVSAAAGAIVALAVLWRWRRTFSRQAVALWIEERLPTLRYALVTVLDPRWAGAVPELECIVAGARWGATVARAVARAAAPPLVLLVLAGAIGAVLPAGIVARINAPRPGDALARMPRGEVAAGNRLVPIVATVTPPAYSGLRAETHEEPVSVAGLAASSVRLEGRGGPDGIEAALGEAALAVTGGADRWRVIFAMPRRATAVRLRDGRAERIVVLEPRADSAPVVTLAAPARDTVLRTTAGAAPLRLVARATDDFGLAALWFEYIVSSGEGETFTFRSGVVRRGPPRGARAASLEGSLRLDSLALKPGDIVHLRAVAVDGNLLTGPDTGVSETRTLRVPRSGEYDSVAVEGAPPPAVDKSEVSQRMLIQLTEALEKRRRGLARATVVSESRKISTDQKRLRRRVGDIIFARLGEDTGAEEEGEVEPRGAMTPEQLLQAAREATAVGARALDFEGDETPVVAINRPLLEAYNAMWDASRELDIGEPGAALPHMYAALDAIQRARQAERIYLRGKPAAVVVDLAKVRMAGKLDEAAPSRRRARAPLDAAAGRRAARFDAALALLAARPAAAVDSLLLLRVDALESAPALAAALGTAIDALRTGQDATGALVRARRLAAGAPPVHGAASAWGGAW